MCLWMKIAKSRSISNLFFHIFKNADFTLFSGFPENRLTDFLAYYILCFETTYYLSRINTVVVLYL